MAGWPSEIQRRCVQLSGRLRLLSAAIVGTALIAFATAAIGAQAQGPRDFQAPRDCFLSLDQTSVLSMDVVRNASRLQSCAAAAEERPRPGLVFAYFYAGLANRVLGAGPLATPASDSDLAIDSAARLNVGQLQEAARLLEISARMASAPGADGPTRRAGQWARLELARAYRLQGFSNGDRFNDAQTELAALEREGPGDLYASLAYERAMLILDRLPRGEDYDDAQLHSALQDLSAFANVDPHPNDQYIVDRGPTQLARLAIFMGNRALNRQPQTVENTQLALRNFRDAVSAYGVLGQLGRNVNPAEAARIRVQIGLLDLRMASLLGQGQLAEFGCAPGADTYSISEAEANFSAARDLDPQSPDAHWGLGCALMARNNAPAAVTAFQQAVANYNAPGVRALPRGDYYLGLARALALAGQWDGQSGAVANFNAALAGENDGARVASIRLEIARIYAQNQRWSQARTSLESSINAHADPQAYLMLGELLYNHQELDARYTDARASLRRAVAIAGPHQAEANYYLSLVEQNAGNGLQAVAYSVAAAEGDRGNADYRQQACLTHIIFTTTRDQGRGQAYCAADPSNHEEFPRASFYEGMFWLRQAYNSSGGNQRNYWAQAIRSFELGDGELGGRSQLVDNQSLGRLLSYGRRFALYCAGLGAAVQAQPGSEEWNSERSLFKDRYKLDRCWR